MHRLPQKMKKGAVTPVTVREQRGTAVEIPSPRKSAFTIPLSADGSIGMEILRPTSLAEWASETDFPPEAAMFGNARGAILGSRASLVYANFRQSSFSEAALVGGGLLFVIAIASLFGLWLTSLDRGRSTAAGTNSDCMSFGRGGGHCAAPSERQDAPKAQAPSQVCLSLGRGGVICGAYPDARAGKP